MSEIEQLQKQVETLRSGWQHHARMVAEWYIRLRDTRSLNQTELTKAAKYRDKFSSFYTAGQAAWLCYEQSRTTDDLVMWYALSELRLIGQHYKYDTGSSEVDHETAIRYYFEAREPQVQP